MEKIITGKCWTGGEGVTVYQIIPESHWTMGKMDANAMADWIFPEDPQISGEPGKFRSLGYSIVVAGNFFGCGSKSVEHPIAALKASGVKLILADSVSRYSYRNAINLGLPVLVCPGISEKISRNDVLKVNLMDGSIENVTKAENWNTEGLGDFAAEIIAADGLLEYLKNDYR